MLEFDAGKAYIVHLRSQHQRLERDVQAIRERLFGRTAADWRERLRSDLSTLRSDLAGHFNEEEEGGCIEEAVSRRPALSEAARLIERQHPQLLRQLDQLIERAHEGEQAAVRHAFADFAQRLLAHEALENQIIEQGFNVNLENGVL